MLDHIEIKNNWKKILDKVKAAAARSGRKSSDIKIIAVSKTQPYQVIKAAVEAGVPIFGENYAQELSQKHEAFSKDGLPQPEWHFIGHLQTNKVRLVAPLANTIHSVDSIHLAEEISKQAAKAGKTMNIMLQVNTSGEDSKFGCQPDELEKIAESVVGMSNLKIKGLMTIGSFSENEKIYRREFRLLRSLGRSMRKKFPAAGFDELSMGMSGDFEAAIEEGSTCVRIGTAIFGLRDYSKI